jgi:hypothetical protein
MELLYFDCSLSKCLLTCINTDLSIDRLQDTTFLAALHHSLHNLAYCASAPIAARSDGPSDVVASPLLLDKDAHGCLLGVGFLSLACFNIARMLDSV